MFIDRKNKQVIRYSKLHSTQLMFCYKKLYYLLIELWSRFGSAKLLYLTDVGIAKRKIMLLFSVYNLTFVISCC